jgi:hypothetical protein
MHTTEAAGEEARTGSVTALSFLYAALVLPSLFIVQKFIGSAGTMAYAGAAALTVLAWPRIPFPRTRRGELVVALALFAVLVIVFAWFYPRVNLHLPMQGSDDDDAYNVGAGALLAGRSPYLERTYLGNALHQFAGAFILAMPFVLAGTSALQNLFWIPMFFAAGRAERGNRRALRLAALILAASPVVLHQVASGTGHIANAIYVVLGLWWLVRTERHRLAASLAWGVALASRANFLFLLPFAFASIRRHAGLASAVLSTALTSAVVVLLVVPFYLASPHDFGPLESANRLTRFDGTVPHTGALLIVVMGLLALWLAFSADTVPALFRNAAVVQAFPVIAGTALGVIEWRVLDLGYLEYVSFAAWFAFMGWLVADRPGDRASEPAAAHQGRR